MVVRWLAALAAFVVVIVIGMVAIGELRHRRSTRTTSSTPRGPTRSRSSAPSRWSSAFVVYAAVEYVADRRLESIARQFDTRTIVLMPIAMAINIILGATVANALKIPIYLDSIGTILVGALAGPIAGRADRLPVEHAVDVRRSRRRSRTAPAAAFAIVAVVIGVHGRPRRLARAGCDRGPTAAAAELVVGGAGRAGHRRRPGVLRLHSASTARPFEFFNPDNADPLFIVLGWLVGLIFVGHRRRLPRPALRASRPDRRLRRGGGRGDRHHRRADQRADQRQRLRRRHRRRHRLPGRRVPAGRSRHPGRDLRAGPASATRSTRS